jgi:CubicO group peptidase (beta-lactamase class C family)
MVPDHNKCDKNLDLKIPIQIIMDRFIFFSFLLILVFSADCLGQRQPTTPLALNSSNPLNTVLDKKIDARIRHAFKRKKLVGIAIGILKNGQTTFYGYGETKKENGQLPDEHTIFEIGSITKTFTGTLLACAVTDEKSSLNDPVNKYLPDSIPLLEYQGTPVTLVTLSNHTSGLPRMPSNFNSSDEGHSFMNYDDSDLYSFYMNFKLPRKPGEKLEYSNLAVGTLGVILERIYRTGYDSLVVKLICDPLNMNDTRLDIPSGDSLRFAQGYSFDGKAVSAWNFKAFAGAGGLRSTAADMLKYAHANMGDAPSTLNKAILLTHKITSHVNGNGIGLGWAIYRTHHRDVFAHNGETGGFQSFLIIDPATQIAIVVLANKATNDDDAMDDIGVDIIKMLEKV